MKHIPLIPRAKLFGNPARTQVRLSPDGKHISWLQPKDGVLNVFVAPLERISDATPATDDRKRGIRMYGWSQDSKSIRFGQDKDGDENWHVHAVKPGSLQSTRDLTPYGAVMAQVAGSSFERPTTIAVLLNDRDPAWHDLYLIDTTTGIRTLVFQNDGGFGSIGLDRQMNVRTLEKPRDDGGRTIFRSDGKTREEWLTISHEDDLTTGLDEFTKDGRTLYMQSSIGRDKAALFAVDWATGQQSLLAEHPKADIGGGLIVNPVSYEAEAYGVEYLTSEWHPLLPAIKPDLARLNAKFGEDFQIVSRPRHDRSWIVAELRPENPGRYHLFDRASGECTFLFDQRPDLSGERLCTMHPVAIPSRDGHALVSYLSLPAEVAGKKPTAPLPLVLTVHGGPWARDSHGFDAEHQWLANRGYAALSVNFRGSTGFGKAFLNAGDGEWAAKMHDDLIDAVEWAIAAGIADRTKIAITGGSYGGYATLVGLAFTPGVFACGVDIVGPSNLETLLATVPPYWAAFFENLARRVGDPRTEAGRKLLQDRSPLHRADKITKPLLIAQGANDPRVKQAEADQIVAAMTAKGLPVVYALYPDEGHGFAVPENRIAFFAIEEAFLASILGGRAEPFGGEVAASSVTVPAGAATITGLQAALSAKS